VVERNHPNVAGSRNRLVRVSARGEIRQEVERDDWHPFGVVCEQKTGQASVVDYGKRLIRVPLDKDPLEPLPIAAMAVAIGSNSGQIWTATKDEIIRLKYGVAVVRTRFGKPAGQGWLAAL
jgi:hypothetical protein